VHPKLRTAAPMLTANDTVRDIAHVREQLVNVIFNKLPFLDPSAANFFNPVLVTTPIVEIIGDRGVTAAGLVRILRHVGCWFVCSFRSDRWLSAVHLSRSSRRFAVAHLACLINVRETDVAHLSSTKTMPQAGHQRRQHV